MARCRRAAFSRSGRRRLDNAAGSTLGVAHSRLAPSLHARSEARRFSGRLVIVGFGSIGQGVLPLLLRHIDIAARADHDRHRRAARAAKSPPNTASGFIETALTRDNYRARARTAARRRRFPAQRLGRRVERRADRALPGKGRALPRHLHRAVAGRLHRSEPAARRRAPTMRCAKARWRCAGATAGGPTAVLTHGANPGLVSHFVKQALVDLARDTGLATAPRPSRADWARLAERLGVKAIHIAERDTQVVDRSRRSRANSSTPGRSTGFVSEGSQPAELGWGTHERHFPPDGRRHDFGCERGDLSAAAGRGDAGPQLDAARRPLSRLSDHPRRVDLDRRLPDACARRHGRATGRPATTPIIPATTRC